jgi:ubiquinone/menaquinone biosynthesis C-methylase UbiE
MGFDLLAPHYRWMEFVLAGGKLQRCRTAFLEQIEPPSRILLVGEGNGRFLASCRLRFPKVPITLLDSSARMLAAAKSRMSRNALGSARIDYLNADILQWESLDNRFDLIVTHFFLDCFPPSELREVVGKLAAAATSTACWLLADFQVPPNGLVRLRA